MQVAPRNSETSQECSIFPRPARRFRILGLPIAAWVVIDSVLVNIAFVLAYVARYPLGIGGVVDAANWSTLVDWWQTQVWFWLSLIALLMLEGIYRARWRLSLVDQIGAIVRASIVSGALIAALSFVLRPPSQSRFVFLYMCVLVVVLLGASRLLIHTLQVWRFQRGLDVRRVLVVGESTIAKMVLQRIAGNPNSGLRIVGFLTESSRPVDFGRFRALGQLEDLPVVLRSERIDQVIIALPARAHAHVVEILNVCREVGSEFAVVPDMLELSLAQVDIESLGGIPLLGVRESPLYGWNLFVKRVIDVGVASVALFVLAIPMLIAALAIRLDSPGPIILVQERVGKGGRVFRCYKFRSMVQNADALLARMHGQNEAGRIIFKSRNDPRRTRVGKLLRRLSFDEVPQLFNVLKGDMSLVGPRPPLVREYAEYEEWMKGRLEVMPGLTGLWQVSGRSDLVFDEMVLLDLYYAENWSPGLDLKILLLTIPALLTGRGAY